MSKKAHDSIEDLKKRYEQLRESLCAIGYISQGSVFARTVETSGRSGFQWTRKVNKKTVTVALSSEQFTAMKEAIQNERRLWKTIREMEVLSRQILFGSMPDTNRRKRLSKKVLGTK
jgi:hypothetical protein